MDLPVRMRIIYGVKGRRAIRLKFGDKFVNSITTVALQAKPSICTTRKSKIAKI